MQVWLLTYAELHFTEMESLNCEEKKKKSPQRQIALKFSPAAKLLQKNRTFSGKKKYIKSGLNLYW